MSLGGMVSPPSDPSLWADGDISHNYSGVNACCCYHGYNMGSVSPDGLEVTVRSYPLLINASHLRVICQACYNRDAAPLIRG